MLNIAFHNQRLAHSLSHVVQCAKSYTDIITQQLYNNASAKAYLNIYDVKHLRWSNFVKMVNFKTALTIFEKCSIIDI